MMNMKKLKAKLDMMESCMAEIKGMLGGDMEGDDDSEESGMSYAAASEEEEGEGMGRAMLRAKLSKMKLG